LGSFVSAVYTSLDEGERETVERAILGLPNDQSSKRTKVILAGCIPTALVATSEMRAFMEVLEQENRTEANRPPVQIVSSFRAFDTDTYLASEGVALKDPESAALRELMRNVEALPKVADPSKVTSASAI